MGVVIPFTPRRSSFVVKVADGSISTNPMRRLVYRECQACGFAYCQPSPTGNCPQCHEADVINTGEGVCVAPYRK